MPPPPVPCPAKLSALPAGLRWCWLCGSPWLPQQHGCGVVVPPGPSAGSELAVITTLSMIPNAVATAAAALDASRHYTPPMRIGWLVVRAGGLIDKVLGLRNYSLSDYLRRRL